MMLTSIESLKEAARNYLRALEGDGPQAEVDRAKERLVEIGMLWAQAEAIESVKVSKMSGMGRPDSEKDHKWTLCTTDAPLGVFSDEEHLKSGVDYWMKKHPGETLHFLEWEEDYIPEPLLWGWAYIAPDSDVDSLASGVGNVPRKWWWGKNLIGIEYEPIEET